MTELSSSRMIAASITAVALTTAVWSFVAKKRSTCKSDRNIPDFVGNSSGRSSDVVKTYEATCCFELNKNSGREGRRTYIVTGATSGLGLHASRLLVSAGAHVILAVRNMRAGTDAVREITSESPAYRGKAECMYLDLSELDTVRAFAATFVASGQVLHGLCKNAGVFLVAGTTVDGYQITWQTNCLAPALLTELLLPATSSDFRVVNVSSKVHNLASNVLDRCPPSTSGASYADYALSKACQILHARELNIRFAKEAAQQQNQQQQQKHHTDSSGYHAPTRRAFAVEPGLVKTKIMRESGKFMQWLNYSLLAPMVKNIDQGTSTILFCLLAPLEHLGTCSPDSSCVPYYYNNCAPEDPSKCCRSAQDAMAVASMFHKAWS